MKHILLIHLFILSIISIELQAQNVGVGTNTPDNSAKLDINASSKGVLIPRVALTISTSASPITTPQNSLLVYNTATVTDVFPGYYYWSASSSSWVRLIDSPAWHLNGNTGVTGSHFVGSINAADLKFKTTNTTRATISSLGNFGIGDITPNSLLTVGNGDLFQVDSSGRAKSINGTASLPSFSFVNDNDNGMYLSSANELSFSTAGFQRAVINSTGLLGLKTNLPNTTLDVNGDFSFREGLAPIFINGANNNIAGIGTSNIKISGPTAAFSITGFTGGQNGKILVITNTTTQTMTIANEGVTSLATNRINNPNFTNLVLEGIYSSVVLQYNSSINRWIVTSYTDGLITDHDFYEVGTTASPTAITNNKFTQGDLAIGYTDPLGHALLLGGTTNTSFKIGQTGGLNNIESGRIIFDEAANTYSPGTFCGMEIHHDGASNKLHINGGCIVPINIATFERTGDIGIATTDPTEQLEIGGTDSKLYFNSLNSNMITYNTNGVAVPTLTSRSLGTKILLYPQVTATTSDYAIGIGPGNLWMSIPDVTSAYSVRWYTAATEAMRFTGTGRLGIGTTNPTATRLMAFDPSVGTARVAIFKNATADGKEVQVGSVEYLHDYSSTTDFNDGANSVGLSINYNASATFDLQLANNSAAKPGSNAWTIASDARLKEDIQPFKDGLTTLRKINPIYYKYNGKAHTPKDEYYIGIVAQEMKEIAPYTIGTFETLPNESDKTNIETYYSYNSHALDYVTINAIKELDEKQTKVETVYKNISDFGITQLNTLETYIPYSSIFQNNLDESVIPVVTATPINSMITVTIISQDAHGFTVRKSEDAAIQINWIAMAKVKDHLFETNTNYTKEERNLMLEKVKAPNNSLRKKIDYENEQLKKFKAEQEAAEQLDKKNDTTTNTTTTKVIQKDDDQ